MRQNGAVKSSAQNILILLFLFINLLPLLIALSSSFRSPDNMTTPLAMFTEFSLESYEKAFERMHFITALSNSVLLTGVSVVFIVIFASMAAYPIARVPGKAGGLMSAYFLAGLIIPGQMAIMPVYMVLNKLNINSPQLSPIIMFITCSMPFSTFLYTGFIRASVPFSLEEAAVIDGAGMLYRFWRIVFPLILPATMAVVITMGVWIWNDFFYAMLFISKSANSTLPLVMMNFMGDRENPTQWNILFAACFLCAVPLLLLFSFLQRYFLSGLTIGGVKG